MSTAPASVRVATPADAARVGELHAAEIPEGFLPTLGLRFLRRLYARAARSPHAFVHVAERDGSVTGFVATAESTGALYRDFLLHDGVRAGLAAAPAVLRAPRRTFETLRYGTGGSRDEPDAEILAIAVDPTERGRGTGAALLAAAVGELWRRDIAAAKVVTTSTNDAALRMYERGGFHPHSRTEVHAGVPQEVLVWSSR